MFADGVRFGVETETGAFYVTTCRGKFTFESAEDAAGFVAARTLARLSSYRVIWNSFDTDRETFGGQLAESDGDIPS
jgi:hypothetical protein